MRPSHSATPARPWRRPLPPGSPKGLAAATRKEREESHAVRQLETRLLLLRRKAQRADTQMRLASRASEAHGQLQEESKKALQFRADISSHRFMAARAKVDESRRDKDRVRGAMEVQFEQRQQHAAAARLESRRVQCRLRDETAAELKSLKATAATDRSATKKLLLEGSLSVTMRNTTMHSDTATEREKWRDTTRQRRLDDYEEKLRSAQSIRSGRAAVRQAREALENRKHEERNELLQQLTESKRTTATVLGRYREKLEDERRVLEARVRNHSGS